jgi:hypothetical protein
VHRLISWMNSATRSSLMKQTSSALVQLRAVLGVAYMSLSLFLWAIVVGVAELVNRSKAEDKSV